MRNKKLEQTMEIISRNPRFYTPRMISDILWCTEHREEIEKMFGLIPCDIAERYQIQRTFLMEGQTGLFIAMEFYNIFGKTDEEIAEQEEQAKHYIKKIPSKHKLPYDYDLEYEYQENTFIKWCDDHDCAILVKKNNNEDILRLSYIALAVGFKEFSASIWRCIDSETLTGDTLGDSAFEEKSAKWVKEFIEKQPEGENKKDLKKRLEINWALLKEAKQNYSNS